MLGSTKRSVWNVCCIALGCIFSIQLHAQNFKDPAIGISNRVYVQYTDSLVETFYYKGDKKIKTDDELFYYWYGAQDIKHTRGAFEGKLLHGTYTMFYYNKDLLCKGAFKYGLKNGEWKSWHQGGELKSKEKWRNGKIVGTSYYYGRNGKIQKERKLSGSGTGCIIYYDEKGVLTSKEYYKNNTLDKKINYQLNEKGKVVEIKPEKIKSGKQKKTTKQKSSASKEKKIKGKKQKQPKVKIQKYREIVPGGIGT